MTEKDVLKIFRETKALLSGHFKLSSGLHSASYLQCAKLLQYPKIAEKLCKNLAAHFKKDKPTCVIAPALGGVIVSYEVSRSLGAKALFTERLDAKMVLRRGFEITQHDRVLVVEDVITTGLSTREVIDVVKSKSGQLIGVGSIVDRSGENIDFGVKLVSLLRLDLPVFSLDECPLCRGGIEITKPGSR